MAEDTPKTEKVEQPDETATKLAELIALIRDEKDEKVRNAAAEKVETLFGDIRKETARYRTKGTQAEEEKTQLETFVGELRKALGTDDDDPESLKGAITDRDTKLRKLAERDAVREAAAKHHADPELVAALLAQQGAFADIAEDKLAETADAATKELVVKRPNIKVNGQAPGRSGPPPPTDDTPQFTREDLAKMSTDDYAKNRDGIMAALAEGRVS